MTRPPASSPAASRRTSANTSHLSEARSRKWRSARRPSRFSLPHGKNREKFYSGPKSRRPRREAVFDQRLGFSRPVPPAGKIFSLPALWQGNGRESGHCEYLYSYIDNLSSARDI